MLLFGQPAGEVPAPGPQWRNLVDALDSKSSSHYGIEGSSPSCGTKQQADYQIGNPTPAPNQMVVTRFAPSPTGQLHLGAVRTALFNWLWARKNGGQFILRLEDTDQQRLIPGADQQILDDLRWLGLGWDWGPDRPHPDWGSAVQSQRRNSYQQTADQLVKAGLAYYDQTSPDELGKLRQQAQQEKRPFVFRQSMASYQPNSKQPTVIRVAVPDNLKIDWLDQVKGKQSWRGSDIGDFVILKSDGWPTYQLANVVDDQAMSVSHVIRADEWLSSTPKHLYLFDQLGYSRPIYAHVPPVMAPTGNRKLSKRDGGGINVSDCRRAGYPPAAVTNCLALLGWNPGNEQEVFSPQELVDVFDLDRLQTAAARFDPQRLDWLSGHHIRRQTTEQRLEIARSWWPDASQDFSDDYRRGVLELVFERLKKWSELPGLTHYFFADPETPTDSEIAKAVKLEKADPIRQIVGQSQKSICEADLEQLEANLYGLAEKLNLKPGQVFMVLRLKLTGESQTPNLVDIIKLLGPEICQRRLADNMG